MDSIVIPRRPPINGSAQDLDDFIVNATTPICTSILPSTSTVNDRLYDDWYRFFLQAFQNKLSYYERVLCCGAHNAQEMIEVIQTLLAVERVDKRFKIILETALSRLAQTYQMYPKGLVLNDVLAWNALLAWKNGAVRGTHNGKVVSVKIYGRMESSVLEKQILIWTQLRHDNVLPLYGMCKVARYDSLGQYIGIGLVSQFQQKGNITDFLKGNRFADRQSFIFDVALGMSYLHENEVVHGRIHGRNILITTSDPPRACLADFGPAPHLPGGTGTVHLLAPELHVLGSPRTKASDVYAFSTTSYEILTKSDILQEDWSPSSDITFKQGDNDLGESTRQLLLDSWRKVPNERPKAWQIVESLKKMRESRIVDIEQQKSVLTAIFKTEVSYRQLLSYVGADAQEVFDVFQLLLDTGIFQLQDPVRRQLITAMRRLSERTGLYPSRFSLNFPLPKTEDEPAASGGFADVFKVEVKVGSLDHEICVKMIRRPPNVEGITKMYAQEVITWGQLSHPNILPFYGLASRGSRLYLASRWAVNGNLTEYLQHNPKANRVHLCLDTAAGVKYLHKNDIVHGDLKGNNILIDSSGRACLCDFGLSSVTDPEIIKWISQSTEASSGGSIRWQAPELHKTENMEKIHNSKESDVFAWGGICYEAFTGRPPFHEIRYPLSVMDALRQGTTPTRPNGEDLAWSKYGLNEDIWNLMQDCWTYDPSQRPNMTDIIARLNMKPDQDTRPSDDWEEKASMRFRNGQNENTNLTGDLTLSLWNRLEKLLARITVPEL